MRELHTNEMEIVSAAGIFSDEPGIVLSDPAVKEALSDFDTFCNVAGTVSSVATQPPAKMVDGVYLSTPGVGIANKVVHGAVEIMDVHFTKAFNNIMKPFG